MKQRPLAFMLGASRAYFLFSVASSLKNEIEATSFHAGGITSIVSLLCGKLVKK
jgi:hypothetical protein